MKRLRLHLISASLLMLLAGCASDRGEPDQQLEIYDAPESNIISMVEGFHKSVGGEASRSETLVIDEIRSDYYRSLGDSEFEPVGKPTRAEKDSNVYDISTVIFHNGEDKGFALVSAHEKINRVIFYTPKGELSDTVKNETVKDIIDMAPYLGASVMSGSDGRDPGDDPGDDDDQDNPAPNPGDGGEGGGGGSPGSNPSPYIYRPVVLTRWHQKSPYNRFTRRCECGSCSDNHTPTGCVTIATAQFIAYFGKFTGVSYANRDIDFFTISHMTRPYYYQDEAQIAHFIHEVALGCQIEFACGGSSSHPKAAYHYLRDLGYDVVYRSSGLDTSIAKNCLSKGWPIIAAGKKGLTKSGHVWLIDGMKYENNVTSYHCNWGEKELCEAWIDSWYVYKSDNGDEERHYWYDQHYIYVNSFN